MFKNKEETAKIFKALCDVNRVRILEHLQTGPKCSCDIGSVLDIAQSKLSYHMKILCESGIVKFWHEGKWTHYSISEEGSAYALELLKQITSTTSNEIVCKCSSEVKTI